MQEINDSATEMAEWEDAPEWKSRSDAVLLDIVVAADATLEAALLYQLALTPLFGSCVASPGAEPASFSFWSPTTSAPITTPPRSSISTARSDAWMRLRWEECWECCCPSDQMSFFFEKLDQLACSKSSLNLEIKSDKFCCVYLLVLAGKADVFLCT